MGFVARAGKPIAIGVLVILGLLALAALIVGVLFTWLDKTNGEIVSSGEKRRYLIFVPTTYDPARPTPLVISLHDGILATLTVADPAPSGYPSGVDPVPDPA